MTQTTDNCILVAAIDFGTSYSGYAFSTRNDFEKDPLQIQVNPPWAAGTRQLLSLKTPTCLLLDADKNYVAFGYDAEDKYSELALLKEHESYYYFQRFKMSLYHTQNLNKDLVVEDMTGKQFSAFDVCCLSIKALKDHLLESISKQFINMNIDDIRWVLTVPAIWTDSAKQFMRRSAEKAGIPSDKLQISLEPEAASIYCQHLPIENLKGAGKRLSATVAGTRCIIADLGGSRLKMAQSQDHLLVAAIDFGTTYSGYAFSMKDTFKTDPLKIYANQAWNAGGKQLLSLKTPTCILLDSNKQFDSFGYDAENRYADLVMDEEHEDYYYFHRFKMSLHNNKNVKQDMMIEDITGKSVNALDVFALSIEALKNHLISALETQGTGVKPSEIRWVLTVPAIWTDNAKQFMRKGAEMAGIPKNCLLISLEPEAASIYCQYLPTEKFRGIESGFTMSSVGTKYMVVDLGGGTADITIHEKLVGDNLKEICRASGGDCGGTSVDAAFIQMLAKIFGAPLINSMKQEEPAAYLDLLREFETVKRTVTSSKSGKINMAIPFATLDSLCKKHLGEDLLSSLSSSPFAHSITMRGDKMRIDANLFRSFFDKTIQSLIQLVKDVLEQEHARSVEQVLLVGGFSECSFIQEAIKKTFNTCRVVVPKECGLAVLQGAVLFGHKPSFIASRISRFTYGIAVNRLFDADLHDVKYKTIINGEERCGDIFDVIMEKDAHIPAGTVVKKKYNSHINHNRITFRIFVSGNSCPMYVLEDGCTELGSVSVKITNSSIKHKCDVELVFGNTELSIIAKETDSSCVFEANFDLI